MEVDNPVHEYLKLLHQRVPENLKPWCVEFMELYEQKLWHQLTIKTEEFMQLPGTEEYRIEVYKSFISEWEKYMNKIKMILLGLVAARQFKGVKDARDFLATLAEKVNKAESRDAYILAKLEEAHFNLLLNEIDLAKETIENADKVITGLEKMEPVVYGSYYRVSADYYKVKAEFGQYYKNALLLLACINLSELSEEEKLGRTIDLSLAALLSDTIYNFGDLLSHPIIETLKNSESGWLYELIFAFNGGDIGKLEGLVPKFKSQPLLLENIEFLRHKIRLMALIESVFRRQGSSDTSDRNIPFETLAQETQLPVSEIEHLVMSALSLGLIRGKIDEVDRTVFFQWVQPRYLGKAQIEGMSSRLKQWAQRTGDMKSTLENFITLEGLVKQ